MLVKADSRRPLMKARALVDKGREWQVLPLDSLCVGPCLGLCGGRQCRVSIGNCSLRVAISGLSTEVEAGASKSLQLN
jgi:hypothetical protein